MDRRATQDEWPQEPYKGLAYYVREDRKVFAGRQRDISSCMQRLTSQTISIFVLYGQTGCGKSSFLRAGLIPSIEETEISYTFLSEVKDGKREPTFVRSTGAPLIPIAKAVYDFLANPTLSHGTLKADLSEAKLGCDTVVEFIKKCERSTNLLKSLTIISRLLPSTLLIVLDQAEEVLTLGGETDKHKRAFFEFLKKLVAAQISIKLLVALRREHLGPFLDLARIDEFGNRSFTQYELEPLNETQVREAILRPTIRGDAPEEPPYEFDIDPEVIERLLEGLFKKGRGASVLPVMQIVCRDLYREMRKRGEPKITMEIFDAGQGVEGRLDQHISRSLRAAFRVAGFKYDYNKLEEKWRSALLPLAQFQPDGTVGTDHVPARSLHMTLTSEGIPDYNRDKILDRLCDGSILILRSFTILNPVNGESELRYALGHDAIGLGLWKWEAGREEAKKSRRSRVRAAVGVFIAMISAGFAIFVSLSSDRAEHFAKLDNLLRTSQRTLAEAPAVSLSAAIAAKRIQTSNLYRYTDLNNYGDKIDAQISEVASVVPDVDLVGDALLSGELFATYDGSEFVVQNIGAANPNASPAPIEFTEFDINSESTRIDSRYYLSAFFDSLHYIDIGERRSSSISPSGMLTVKLLGEELLIEPFPYAGLLLDDINLMSTGESGWWISKTTSDRTRTHSSHMLWIGELTGHRRYDSGFSITTPIDGLILFVHLEGNTILTFRPADYYGSTLRLERNANTTPKLQIIQYKEEQGWNVLRNVDATWQLEEGSEAFDFIQTCATSAVDADCELQVNSASDASSVAFIIRNSLPTRSGRSVDFAFLDVENGQFWELTQGAIDTPRCINTVAKEPVVTDFKLTIQDKGDGSLRVAIHCDLSTETRIFEINADGTSDFVASVYRWGTGAPSSGYFSEDGRRLSLILEFGHLMSWDLSELEFKSQMKTDATIAWICERHADRLRNIDRTTWKENVGDSIPFPEDTLCPESSTAEPS